MARLASLVLCLYLAGAPAMDLAAFRAQPDNRAAVRASLGVRAVRSLSATRVEVTVGASANDVAGRAEAWRVVSETDPAYAYAALVRPREAGLRREIELAPWSRLIVTLDLPSPLKAGCDYAFIGQGAGDQVLTGGRTAAGLIFGREPEPRDARLDLAVLAVRAVRPIGPRLVEVEAGPALQAGAANRLDLYRVTVGGQPARVEAMGRWTGLDTYRPVGWPFEAIVAHRLYLRLDRDFAAGTRVEVELLPALCGGDATARTAGFDFDPLRTWSPSLQANQVGYLPDRGRKIAYLGRWLGSYPEGAPAARPSAPAGTLYEQFGALLRAAERATSRSEAPTAETAAPAAAAAEQSPALWFAEPPRFAVHDEASGRQVFEGQARLVHRSGQMTEGYYRHDHSGANVWQLDFSDLRTPGRYVVTVPGVGRSLPFAIGADVYRRPFEIAAQGVYSQRCGCELGPPATDWRRIACHRAGLTPTTQLRGEAHDIHDLGRKIDYERGRRAPLDPALLALDRDPALVAWYRLEGDLADSAGGHVLRPRRDGQAFSADTMLLPGENRCFGPTGADEPLGAEADLACDATGGYSVAGWVRHQGGINFGGTLFGFPGGTGQPRLAVQASWGVLRAIVGQGAEISLGRVEDGRWHHVAVTVEADRHVRAWLDGRLAGEATTNAPIGGARFVLGALEGKELAGKFIDEVRCYRRALSAAEVATLGTRWVERAGRIDAYGGHHDAGDYNPRSHLDVAQTLMDAYEMAPAAFADNQLPVAERGNGLPDILDEADWALRLWRGLQDADGGVFGGTESDGDPNFLQTVDLDTLGDYAYAKDTGASLELAGALAQWSRILAALGRDGSADLARARRAYEWALAHEPRAGAVRAYAEGYLTPLAYASAELLRTTGEARFARDFARAAVWTQRADADPAVYGLYDQARAALGYCRVPPAQADPALQAACRASLLRWADWYVASSATMAYGFVRHPQAPITWGTGANLHYAVPVLWAWWLSGEPRYLDWVLRSCDNLLGANPLGLCYLTGVGSRGVHAPLHNSRYRAVGEAVDGLLVNGPNARGEGYRLTEVAYPPIRPEFASLYTFADCHFAIAIDEGLVRNQVEVEAVFGLLAGLDRGR